MRASGLMKGLAPWALAIGVMVPGLASAAGLDRAEKAMVASVQRDQDRAVRLLESLVNVNSGTLNLPGVEQNGRMIAAELEPLGFKVRWVPMAHTGRAGHLIAEHHGKGGGKKMLLIAHIDTVFEPHSPFQTFTRRGEVAEGPGVGDIKGGVVIIITALRAMKAAGVLDPADITIVLTGDEEKPGAPHAASQRPLARIRDRRPGQGQRRSGGSDQRSRQRARSQPDLQHPADPFPGGWPLRGVGHQQLLRRAGALRRPEHRAQLP
jgi:glutamate carboxypeptidase